MLAFLSLVSLLLFTLVRAQNQGTITSPAAGAKLQPGQSFPFAYHQHQDYCVSSHNITVALRTSAINSDGTTTGHYFGRFATGNYPNQGYPNPNPPVPSSLTVPNFSLAPGGFGAGKVATNLPVWVTVIEEWNSCTPTVGNSIYVTQVQAVYNSTS